MTGRAIPAYLDGLIAAYRAGQAGRDIHLGYWDRPPDMRAPALPGEFTAAQARFTAQVIERAEFRAGQRVLDIGCGLGGTLAAIAARYDPMALCGLNIDRRQLALCRSLARGPGTTLALVEADACALPFAEASFDRLLAIEAMFHFRSRRRFLGEAARLLKPGGRLMVTDILLQDPEDATPWPAAAMTAAVRREYGPWPEPWLAPEMLERWAAELGLGVLAAEDWTAATLPSYRTIAPHGAAAGTRPPDAGSVLAWLHGHGRLAYRMLIFARR